MLLHDLLTGKPCDPFLEGRRVLVVEDDYVQATDLCEHLQFCGAEVVGPVACVADALALMETEPPPDMAVLDIRLGNETVYPVADALRALGIPFVFAIGHDAWAIPESYADVPRVEKPLASRAHALAL